ncbi:MAG: hypothetical protein H8E13_03405 [Actinobacteria bacterium]|nr:hypothetical protein [Actinomycetota bacterium]
MVSKAERLERQKKLWGDVVKVLRKIVEDELNVLIYTKTELVRLINKELPEGERISIVKLNNYERRAKASRPKHPIYEKFLNLLELQRARSKRALFTKMEGAGSKDWQRYAWMIERLYDEWNIRKKEEIKIKGQLEQEIHDVRDQAAHIALKYQDSKKRKYKKKGKAKVGDDGKK